MVKKTKKTKVSKKKVSKKIKKANNAKVVARPADSQTNNHLKGMRKLDETIVNSIRKNYRKGKGMPVVRIVEIVNQKGYDVTYASVRNVALGITWKSVK